jgi:hypothetical protein
MPNQIVGTIAINDGGNALTHLTVDEQYFNDNFTIGLDGVVTATGILVANGGGNPNSLNPFGDGSLVDFWKLDENLVNEVDTARPLTGANSGYVDMKYGKGASYNGNSSNTIPSRNNMGSISAWLQWSGGTTTQTFELNVTALVALTYSGGNTTLLITPASGITTIYLTRYQISGGGSTGGSSKSYTVNAGVLNSILIDDDSSGLNLATQLIHDGTTYIIGEIVDNGSGTLVYNEIPQ